MRAIHAFTVGVVVAALLAGCAGTPTAATAPTAASAAAEFATDPAAQAEYILDATLGSMDLSFSSPVDAEELAARFLQKTALPSSHYGGDYTVETLDWAGTPVDADGARITLRISAHLPQSQSTRCWTVSFFQRDLRPFERQELDCPDLPARVPAAAMTGPFDRATVAALMTDALTADDTSGIRGRLDAALSGRAEAVSTTEQDGEVVVSARGPGEKDCVVGVRHADGQVETFVSFRKNALLPGEMGCDPGLYFAQLYEH